MRKSNLWNYLSERKNNDYTEYNYSQLLLQLPLKLF